MVLRHLVKWKPARSIRHTRVEKANEQSISAFVSIIPRDSWQPMYYDSFDIALTMLAGLA